MARTRVIMAVADRDPEAYIQLYQVNADENEVTAAPAGYMTPIRAARDMEPGTLVLGKIVYKREGSPNFTATVLGRVAEAGEARQRLLAVASLRGSSGRKRLKLEYKDVELRGIEPLMDVGVVEAAILMSAFNMLPSRDSPREAVSLVFQTMRELEEAVKHYGLPWPPTVRPVRYALALHRYRTEKAAAGLSSFLASMENAERNIQTSSPVEERRVKLYVIHRIEAAPQLLPALHSLFAKAAADGQLYITQSGKIVVTEELLYQLIELGAAVKAEEYRVERSGKPLPA